MKVEELRKLIREEVKSAIREELQDMLTEAVIIASTPTRESQPQKSKVSFKDLEKSEAVVRPSQKQGFSDLGSLLEDTKRSLTSSEARDILTNGGGIIDPGHIDRSVAEGLAEDLGFMDEGIDISKLSFVKKAKDVLDLSNKKDRERFSV